MIRPANISVPDFSSVSPFLVGTSMLATEMIFMKQSILSGLDMAPLLRKSDPVTIYMTWHQRSTNEPSHKWLRGRVGKIAEEIMAVGKYP